MIGVILAAGMARRLRPLTDTRPKCLLCVGERTLLQRTVDAMVAAGIQELVVVTGYRAEMLRTFLTEHYPVLNIHFIHNADYEHNNNIFSLWMTRPYTDGHDFLLMDSDILFDPAVLPYLLTGFCRGEGVLRKGHASKGKGKLCYEWTDTLIAPFALC